MRLWEEMGMWLENARKSVIGRSLEDAVWASFSQSPPGPLLWASTLRKVSAEWGQTGGH